MPKLTVKHKAEVINEIDIKAVANIFDIGRDEQNDLVINDKLISGHHIRIERNGNRYLISDLEVAAELFQAAFNAARINVEINS